MINLMKYIQTEKERQELDYVQQPAVPILLRPASQAKGKYGGYKFFFTSVPDLLQANVWLQENQMDEMSVRITQQ